MVAEPSAFGVDASSRSPANSGLAAAARACDDPDTAARLEGIAARNLVRRDGMAYLDVGREWRIGATANYFISRAIAGGTSFRSFL